MDRRECSTCGIEYPGAARFCASCGRPLAEAQGGTPRRGFSRLVSDTTMGFAGRAMIRLRMRSLYGTNPHISGVNKP
jgi:hypothetical protein